MEWKQALKPTWKKLLISLVIAIISAVATKIILYQPSICSCSIEGFKNCINYNSFALISRECTCRCTTLGEVFSDYFLYAVIPFIAIYLIYSVITKLVSNKR